VGIPVTETIPAGVLLVDDRPANLLALEAVLGDLGVTLVRATSGEEALKRVLEADFAAILLDVQMPGLSGFEVARLIRSRPRSRTTPIIFITAEEASAFPAHEAYQLGAVGYLVKPFVPEAVRAKVLALADLFREKEQARRVNDELERRVAERTAALAAANAELLRKQAELTDFVENAVVGLHWVGPDGTVLWANQAEFDLLGYARDEYVGRHIAEFHADRPVIDDILQRLTCGESLHSYEARLRCKDGSVRHVLISSNVYREGGEFRHTRCFTRDITGRKRAEEALREADRRKDEFLASLAHELRNPLAPLRNAVAILQRGPPVDAIPPVVGMMDRQLAHLVRLVDDLLDVSRVSQGKITLRPEPLDLREVAGVAVETSRPAVETHHHALQVYLPDAPLPVVGDRVRLVQVLTNLLNNAAKYTPDGGRIELSTWRDGTFVVVQVTDTGVGIPADMLPRVFDLFTQVGRSLDRAQGGLGIGLSLVQKLVGMHGGTVTAESPGPGLGSTFSIRLPVG
jgi:PAS domain S-box-containing protein